MGEKRFPRIGQRVTLVVSSDHGDEYYPSRVEGVIDNLLNCEWYGVVACITCSVEWLTERGVEASSFGIGCAH